MTITGGAKRTTTDGVHFVAGVATSNVKFADPYDAAGDWWCEITFKPDADFSSASSTDQYLIGKYVDATNYLVVYLRASDGKMCFDHTEGGATEDVVTAETSWSAGTWYHILISKSNTNTKQRIRVNGGTAVEEANGTAISLVADICIGARDDGVSTEGFAGVIGRVIMGNDTLSDAEELNLYNGLPPDDAVNYFCFDEGRASTANDRGTGADNGTLDSSCTWSYGSVRYPCIGLDGINDQVASAATGDIGGEVTYVWVGRMKSLLSANGNRAQVIFEGESGGTRVLLWSPASTAGLQLYVTGGTSRTVSSSSTYTYGDYLIAHVTIDEPNDTIALYLNGVLVGTDTNGIGALTRNGGAFYIGDSSVGTDEDNSQTLKFGLQEGVLTSQGIRENAKYLNNQLSLGLTI